MLIIMGVHLWQALVDMRFCAAFPNVWVLRMAGRGRGALPKHGETWCRERDCHSRDPFSPRCGRPGEVVRCIGTRMLPATSACLRLEKGHV